MSRSVSSNRLSEPLDRGSMGHSPAREIVQLGMTQQKLYSPEVLGSPVNQRCLGASQAMRAVGSRVEPYFPEPGIKQPGVLPCRDVQGGVHPTGKEEVLSS